MRSIGVPLVWKGTMPSVKPTGEPIDLSKELSVHFCFLKSSGVARVDPFLGTLCVFPSTSG